MEQLKCIWCGRERDSLKEIEALYANFYGFRPTLQRFTVCSLDCERRFLKYTDRFNRYGKFVVIPEIAAFFLALISIFVAPFIYPSLSSPRVWGSLLMLIGLLELAVPMRGMEISAHIFMRWPGIRHAGVQGMYRRARTLGSVIFLGGLAVFLWWPWK
jgi:hypothetical protein